MKSHCDRYKIKWFSRLSEHNGLWFHIVGVSCIVWFLFRVVPAPHRIRYPCQQMSITVALGYIAFWSVLFHGLALCIKRVKIKTAAVVPSILVILIIVFTVSGPVFANNGFILDIQTEQWDLIYKDPIGTPQGVKPGRVVWVWDPDATEKDLQGYWWLKENNNQMVQDQMLSMGIQGLAGVEDVSTAWNILFTYFNQIHGYGNLSYQSGEKIAIKINLNNCWESYQNPYTKQDNDRDASPYVVKALLRQLVNIVGVHQEDITIYDASRSMGNWFYNRVYYEKYPAIVLVPEFPDVKYVDAEGGAPGREKVVASAERIYFADDTGLYRTLPTCVVDAKYIINMPLLKNHPIQNGVTLSGKNFFGTWMEPIADIHSYHKSGFTLGNPAPQVDLFAHEDIGGKTLLNVGDGIFGTLVDHRTISKFQMYPFNNDWTNSFFFSQDPVAIDSVMFDFLNTESDYPCEGSQNYLHQAAEPLMDVYDPENDGVYLSDSLGVHEHWDTTVDIFSSERYVGPSGNGIDFITFGEENARPAVIITKPLEKYLTISGREIIPLPITVVLGRIDVIVEINGIPIEEVEKVEFYLDGRIMSIDVDEPYSWTWRNLSFFRHNIETIAYYNESKKISDDITLWKFF